MVRFDPDEVKESFSPKTIEGINKDKEEELAIMLNHRVSWFLDILGIDDIDEKSADTEWTTESFATSYFNSFPLFVLAFEE